MTLKSKTWFGRVATVIPRSTRRMSTHIARLLVLYEDLRIELNAVEQEKITPLDETGAEYRRLYFLRRTLATFREVHSAFQQLNGEPDFRKLVIHNMNEEFRHVWKDAVDY